MSQAPIPNTCKQNYIKCNWVLTSEIIIFKNTESSLLACDCYQNKGPQRES